MVDRELQRERAAWAGYMMGTMRGLSIVTEPVFEETLWRGYLANEVVYEAAAAAGNRSPAELEALKSWSRFFRESTRPRCTHWWRVAFPLGRKSM